MVRRASHSPSVSHSLFPFLHPTKSHHRWCPALLPILMDLLIYSLTSGHFRHPRGHLGGFGCVPPHVGVASRGQLLKMDWWQSLVWLQQGQCSFAWEIPEYYINMPGIAFPTFRPSYAGFSQHVGGAHFCVFSVPPAFQICGKQEVKEHSWLIR